ncbi:MAG: DMT family transporter [Agarilytica sp.]
MSNISYAAITLLAGIGIPIMAALNSALGSRIGSPIPAALILFSLAFAITLAVYLVRAPVLNLASVNLPWYYFLGGVFVAFYVLAITWTAPKLGVANAIFIILLGQIIAAVIIEHFALFNTKEIPLSWSRLAGVGLMAIGIYLSRRGL